MPLYLVSQLDSKNHPSLILMSDPYPNQKIAITSNELLRFRLFWHWLTVGEHGTPILFHKKEMSYAMLCNIWSFLLDKKLSEFLVQQILKHSNLNKKEITIHYTNLTVTHHTNSKTKVISAPSFFTYATQLQCLLHACLNADSQIIQRIFEKSSSKNLQELLTLSNSAMIAHLNHHCTGTPLQMLLYNLDFQTIDFFKNIMNPNDFRAQFIAVFGTDKNTFIAKQKFHARCLCSSVEKVLNQLVIDVNALNIAIVEFRKNFADSLLENKVHNPFILVRAFRIYDDLSNQFSSDEDADIDEAWRSEILSILSINFIGYIQWWSFPRWLQYYANGILKGINNFSYSFECQSNSLLRYDVRCPSSAVHVGHNAFIRLYNPGASLQWGGGKFKLGQNSHELHTVVNRIYNRIFEHYTPVPNNNPHHVAVRRLR